MNRTSHTKFTDLPLLIHFVLLMEDSLLVKLMYISTCTCNLYYQYIRCTIMRSSISTCTCTNGRSHDCTSNVLVI